MIELSNSYAKVKTFYVKERCEGVLKHIQEERERRDKERREAYNKLSKWGKFWATHPDDQWAILYAWRSKEVAEKLLALCNQTDDEFFYLTAEDFWYIQ